MMTKYRFRMILPISAFCLLLSFSPLKVHADTIGSLVSLELKGTGSLSYGNDSVYPYYLSVDGSSVSASLMCVSYDNDISPGESWVAQVQAITGPQQEAAAWLFNDDNQAISVGDSARSIDDQLAAWEIFSVRAQNTAPPDSGAAVQLAAAENAVALGTEPASFYQQFVIYVPQYGWPEGDDVPQDFIGLADFPPGPTPLPTPEPGSLILLGSGLLGLLVFIYRRRRSA